MLAARSRSFPWPVGLVVALGLVSAVPAAATPVVSSFSPARHTMAVKTAPIRVTFDRPLQTSTVNLSSFRVFGRWSGVALGAFAFSDGNATATFQPDAPFSAGEVVTVTLSETIRAADTSFFRTEGYQWQFTVATHAVTPDFQVLDVFSNRSPPSSATRIYGALGADLDRDGWLDLTTVNEVSGDLRVFLNRADGTGLFSPTFLTPVPVGLESSPNESADFNFDGKVDVAVSSAATSSVWVALGVGDGTFSPATALPSGSASHGLGVLDADGDGDSDLVNANGGSNDVAIFLNDGAGNFASPTFFDAGVHTEYALATGDMDGDGILDVIVGGLDSDEVVVALGNGDGTFTPQTPRAALGSPWQLQVGDVNGDGDLDVATANSFESTGSILLGNGDGTLAAATAVAAGSFTIASDLGDLDGDGDLDWVLSNYSSASWRILMNDGSGDFSLAEDVDAPQAGSCAVLMDIDNDDDLDLALIDELDDTITLMQNRGVEVLSPLCPPSPSATCRVPVTSGKSLVTLIDRTPDTKDRLNWKWTAGAATTKPEFGDPLTSESYALCVYDAGGLVTSAEVGAGGTCGSRPCWKDNRTGFSYADRAASADGVTSLRLKAGATGKAALSLAAKGDDVIMPPLSPLTGPLAVQLHSSSAGACWGATFSASFLKDDGVTLRDKAD